VTSVGTTTTMLVIAQDQPFGRWASAAPVYRRAEELIASGRTMRIIEEGALRSMLGSNLTKIDALCAAA